MLIYVKLNTMKRRVNKVNSIQRTLVGEKGEEFFIEPRL